MKNISRIAIAAVGLLAGWAQATDLVPRIDFGSDTDYSLKFKPLGSSGTGSMGTDTDDDAGFGAGGFVRLSTTGSLAAAAVYDTTPDNTPTNTFGDFTFDLDTRLSSASSAILMYFRGTRGDALSTVFNLDGGSGDQIRWFTGTNPTAASAGSAAAGTGSNNVTSNTVLTTTNWIHLRLDVQNISSGGTKTQATLSAYNSQSTFDASTLKFSTSFTFNAGVNTSAGELGVRLSASTPTDYADMDNFAVYSSGTAPTSITAGPESPRIVKVPMIQFISATDLSQKFTSVATGSSFTRTSADDNGFGAGGYVTTNTFPANGHNTMVYDTDAAVGGSQDLFGEFTMDLDFRATAAAQGVGLFFGNGTSRTSKDWVFFNVDELTGGIDRVRFFTGRSMDTGGGSTIATGGDQTFASPLGINGDWIHVRFDVDLINNNTQYSVRVRGYNSQTLFDLTTLKFDVTGLYTVGESLANLNSEIGLSLFANNGGSFIDLDNVTIYSLGNAPTQLFVPEPASMGILIASSALLLFRRRHV